MEEEEKERKFAELKKGDIVMEIEGERVLNEPTEDILKKLQEAKRPLSIRFLKAELEYARSIAADFIIREKLKVRRVLVGLYAAVVCHRTCPFIAIRNFK